MSAVLLALLAVQVPRSPVTQEPVAFEPIISRDDPAYNRRNEADEPQTEDNGPLLERILAADADIAGEWKGFTLTGFDYSTLTITKDGEAAGRYKLHFVRRTDFGNWDEKRTATLAAGISKLNKPVDDFGGTKEPYQMLYVVRANGTEYLLPDANAKQLKTVDQLKRPFAYERAPQSKQLSRKRIGKNPLKRARPGHR
jgi:hypothetical protein